MDVCHRHTSPYRVGGVVESRMARVSESIVLVIDKFGKGEKGFQKVIKNFSEEDFGQSGKKVVWRSSKSKNGNRSLVQFWKKLIMKPGRQLHCSPENLYHNWINIHINYCITRAPNVFLGRHIKLWELEKGGGANRHSVYAENLEDYKFLVTQNLSRSKVKKGDIPRYAKKWKNLQQSGKSCHFNPATGPSRFAPE